MFGPRIPMPFWTMSGTNAAIPNRISGAYPYSRSTPRKWRWLSLRPVPGTNSSAGDRLGVLAAADRLGQQLVRDDEIEYRLPQPRAATLIPDGRCQTSLWQNLASPACSFQASRPPERRSRPRAVPGRERTTSPRRHDGVSASTTASPTSWTGRS